MILLLLHYLRESWGINVPMVFEYHSTRMLLAAVTGLGLSIFLGPSFIRRLYELKIGQPIRKEECPLLGELHEKKQDTPTMGGLLICFSMLVSLVLWMDLQHSYTIILLLTTLVAGAMGAYDDFLKLKSKSPKGLSARGKMLIQGTLAACIAAYLLSPAIQDLIGLQAPTAREWTNAGAVDLFSWDYIPRLYVPFVKHPVVSLGAVGVACGVAFVVVGSSNAVNLTDGLDGLAAGCLIMVAGCLAVIGFLSNNSEIASYLNILYIDGAGELAIYLLALVGACLGFLWYNGYPAQIFMGDTGSLSLGAVIGVSAVLLKRELLLGLIGGVFVMEALSVILQVASFRYRNKKRIFRCAPLHHHFEYKGWPETKVVIRFWIIGLLLAMLGLASIKFQ